MKVLDPGHHLFLNPFVLKLAKGAKGGTEIDDLSTTHILKYSHCTVAAHLLFLSASPLTQELKCSDGNYSL